MNKKNKISIRNLRPVINALNRKTGFALIELIVTFAILTTGITAALALITQSLKSSYYVRNQTIASYLAVEGLELVKNKRDENFIKNSFAPPPVGWLDELNFCIIANGCTIDPADGDINGCGGGGCQKLRYDMALNLYNYDGADPETIFTRKITISAAAAFGNDEREIISEVRWTDKFGAHVYTLKTHIFDWF